MPIWRVSACRRSRRAAQKGGRAVLAARKRAESSGGLAVIRTPVGGRGPLDRRPALPRRVAPDHAAPGCDFDRQMAPIIGAVWHRPGATGSRARRPQAEFATARPA